MTRGALRCQLQPNQGLNLCASSPSASLSGLADPSLHERTAEVASSVTLRLDLMDEDQATGIPHRAADSQSKSKTQKTKGSQYILNDPISDFHKDRLCSWDNVALESGSSGAESEPCSSWLCACVQ